MNIHFIKSSEKKKITAELEIQFGIKKIHYLLIETGKDKIRGFSGHLSKEEIKSLSQLTNIESIGVYLLKKEFDYRLSIEATHLLKEQITKNILEINDLQLQQWLKGQNLEIKTKNKNTLVIQHNQDFIGCGKSNTEKIFNYVPKDRRLKK